MISGVLILSSGVRCISRFYENINLGDLDLTTALLTAMIQFSKELKEGEIHQVELGNRNFYIATENVLHFILIVNSHLNKNDASSEHYWKKIDEIKKRFFEIFTVTEIHKKSGELDYFDQFIPILDKILEEKKEKIQDAFLSVVSTESGKANILYNLENQVRSSNTNTLLNVLYKFVESDGINLLYEAWPYPFIFSTNKEPSFLFVQNYHIGRLAKNTIYTEPNILLGFRFTANQLKDIYYLAYYMQALAEILLSKYRILYRPVFYNRPIDDLFTTISKQNPYHLSQLNDWFTFQNLIMESSLYISSQLENFRHTSGSDIIYAPLEFYINEILLNVKAVLPQLIYALLTQRRLMILGKQIDVVLTLRFIHYIFRIPIFNLWSNDPNPLSLVNGHPTTINLDNYPKESTTIIDLNTHSINNGYSNAYCVQFSHGILEISYYGLEKLRTYIDDKLARLFTALSKIIRCYDIDASGVEWKGMVVQIFHTFLPEEQEMVLRVLEKMSPFLAFTITQVYYKKHGNFKSYLSNLDELYPKKLSELTFIQARLLTFLTLMNKNQTFDKNIY